MPVPISPSASATERQESTVATTRPPRAKRVTFALEANARTRNLAGADIYSQVLWMKLDGLTNESIADATGLCAKTIAAVLDCWKAQVEIKEGPGWQPRRRNPRKTRFAPEFPH